MNHFKDTWKRDTRTTDQDNDWIYRPTTKTYPAYYYTAVAAAAASSSSTSVATGSYDHDHHYQQEHHHQQHNCHHAQRTVQLRRRSETPTWTRTMGHIKTPLAPSYCSCPYDKCVHSLYHRITAFFVVYFFMSRLGRLDSSCIKIDSDSRFHHDHDHHHDHHHDHDHHHQQ